jgi:hypothetical protein
MTGVVTESFARSVADLKTNPPRYAPQCASASWVSTDRWLSPPVPLMTFRLDCIYSQVVVPSTTGYTHQAENFSAELAEVFKEELQKLL